MVQVHPGKVAFITGAASGMGQAVSRDLIKKGWTIAVIDLDRKTGAAAAKEYGGIFIPTNVFVWESILSAFERVWDTYGRIDFVFANAGLVGLEPFYKIQTLPPKKPQMVDNEVNTVGVYYTCYLAMHYMRQNPVKGGQIIITSSAAGIYPSYSIPLYTASKHAVVGFMRCLAPVLLREGIRVNATLPGAVKTPFMSEEGWAAFPESMFTTLDNIVGGVNKLLDDPDASGVALEISQGNYYPRPQHEWSDEAQKLICTAAGKFDPDTML